jgi:hypothetical protein
LQSLEGFEIKEKFKLGQAHMAVTLHLMTPCLPPVQIAPP